MQNKMPKYKPLKFWERAAKTVLDNWVYEEDGNADNTNLYYDHSSDTFYLGTHGNREDFLLDDVLCMQCYGTDQHRDDPPDMYTLANILEKWSQNEGKV